MMANILTNTPKVLIHLVVCITKDRQAQSIQIVVSLHVSTLTGLLKMLRTVQLNNDFRSRYVKIHNIGTNCFLTVRLNSRWF